MSRREAIRLPWPPSGNHQHGQTKTGRRYLNATTVSYREEVGWKAKSLEPFGNKRIYMEILACAPDRRRRDLDNIAKSVSDALMHAGVFDDDSQIDHLSVKRGTIERGDGYLIVEMGDV